MLSSAQFKLSAEKHFLLCLPWKKKIEKPIKKKKTLWELKLFKKLETFISIHPSLLPTCMHKCVTFTFSV